VDVRNYRIALGPTHHSQLKGLIVRCQELYRLWLVFRSQDDSEWLAIMVDSFNVMLFHVSHHWTPLLSQSVLKRGSRVGELQWRAYLVA
jgi:hypothetical protein